MNPHTTVVATFNSHTDAEAAVNELHTSGFPMNTLSIVGRDYQTDEHVLGYYTTGDRMKYWGGLGAFWGGIWGIIFGSGLFFIPGVGPLLVGGPLVGWIIAALESAIVVGGLSAVGAGLYSQGIPKDSILKYETDIKSGKYVLIAHGTAEEAERARDIISTTNPESLDHHQCSHEQKEPCLVHA
jgi:hypothetical protein